MKMTFGVQLLLFRPYLKVLNLLIKWLTEGIHTKKQRGGG